MENEIIDYQIVWAQDALRLCSVVRAMVNKGWEPFGCIVIMNSVDMYQPIIRRDDYRNSSSNKS